MPIQYILSPCRCGPLLYDVVVRHRLGDDGLLQQAVEQHAARGRGAPIEAEHELVEIGVEVLGLNRAMVRAQDPWHGETGAAWPRPSRSCPGPARVAARGR